MTLPASFDPLHLFETLNRHGVRYVVIGGIAARLLGSPTVTRDLDICYARDADNLRTLATALKELHPELRGAELGLPFQLDARTLRAGDNFTLETDAGDLDLMGTPAGSDGYADLVRSATRLDLGGVEVLVAAIDDLIRMKRAAGRPKDLIEVEVLGALRDELGD
ncbi:MAG: hypothetical protein M3P32_02735 [Chloroflexota bacterium]|nr:hypothetical protein [Chloroflexota bacterium]